MEPMHLWQHPKYKTYYVRYSRKEKPPNGLMVSLETKIKKEANALYREIRADWHNERVIDLKGRGKFIKLLDFRDEYTSSRADKDDDTIRADKLAFKKLHSVIGNKAIAMITPRDMDKFKKVCMTKNPCLKKGKDKTYKKALSPVSINTHLRHLRAAFNTAIEWKYLSAPIKFKNVKVPKRHPTPLTREQIKKVKVYAYKYDYEMWRIIIFALYSGCRREEIINLDWRDKKRNVFYVIGKGDKERIVPIHKELIGALGTQKHIGPVFKQWHKDTVSKRCRKIFDACGLPKKLHFHNLRHSAATYLLSNGVELSVVQKLLGHADIRTTQIYAEVLDEVLSTEIDKLSFE